MQGAKRANRATINYRDMRLPPMSEIHPELQLALASADSETKRGCRVMVGYLSFKTGKDPRYISKEEILTSEVETGVQGLKGVKVSDVVQTMRKACRALGNQDMFPQRTFDEPHRSLLTWLNTLKYRQKTRETKHTTCMAFLRWVCGRYFPNLEPREFPIACLTRPILVEYRQYLTLRVERGYITPATACAHMKFLLQWVKWLMASGYLRQISVRGLALPKGKNSKRRIPNHTEVSRFLEAAVALYPKSMMVVLYFLLMVSTGARPVDLETLTMERIDFDGGRVCLQSKGGYPRWIPIGPSLCSMVRRYVESERPNIPGTQYLFVRKSGKPINFEWGRYVFTKVSKDAGINIDGQYAFRHRFATDTFEANVPLHIILYLMGHTTLSELGRYQHVSQYQFQKAINEGFSKVNWWPHHDE